MSPDLRSYCAPHKREPVATSTNSAPMRNEPALCITLSGEDGAHIQIATGSLRIDGAALETKYGALRHHAEFWDGGEDIDEARGDAVAEVFVLGVATGVVEGQDGERVDGF